MKGKLLIISGPSGVGKGTVKKEILDRNPNLIESISCATRKPREGEIEGVHYFFKTEEEFDEMIRNNKFLEYASVYSGKYGTPREFVEEQLENGRDVLLEIDIQGAIHVKEMAPHALAIMLAPLHVNDLKERLIGRNTETEEEINKRFSRAIGELQQFDKFDYVVINETGKLDKTCKDIEDIIQDKYTNDLSNEEIINKVLE